MAIAHIEEEPFETARVYQEQGVDYLRDKSGNAILSIQWLGENVEV